MKFENAFIESLLKHSEYIGDDCALAGNLLFSTDSLVEHIHFDLNYSSPWQVGYKTAAVNISDIAGMGGSPEFFLLSLSLPAEKKAFADDFISGLTDCLKKYNVQLIGGDTTGSSRDIFINGTIIGSVNNKPLYRKNASPGDSIYLTGIPGLSAAGLALLKTHRENLWPDAVNHHLLPEPDVKNGLEISTHSLASAMMDLSDGLSKDMRTICSQSHTGAVIYTSELPLPEGTPFNKDQLIQFAVHGGEDYCLLFTSQIDHDTLKKHISPCYRIGKVTETSSFILSNSGKEISIDDLTFDHF